MYILYHDDLDGICAAAIAVKFGPDSYPAVFPVLYGKPLPFDKIKGKVVLVDFTPETKEEFDKLLICGEVTWLDHHQKNIERYPEYDCLRGIRADTTPSGAMLAWKYFCPHDPVPLAVTLVSDYDTWTHEYSDSKAFHAGICSLGIKPKSVIWDILFKKNTLCNAELSLIVRKGSVILEAQGVFNSSYLERYGFITELEGHTVLACNVGMANSEFFESKEAEIVSPFAYDGEQWKVSLYSKSVNVADIAVKYGGGGHPGAAGFQCKDMPFRRDNGV